MTPTEKHNRVVSEFVMQAGTAGSSGMMVMVESILLSAMLINTRVFGTHPSVACGLVEAAFQRATEQFTEKVKSNG